MKNNIAVIGLGYVGLPLAIEASKAGYYVIGIDKDQNRVNQINLGISPIEDVLNETVLENVKRKGFFATSDISRISEASIIILCLPTPLTANRKPDLSHLHESISGIRINANKGSLIIVESTVAPGTTRALYDQIMEQNKRLLPGDIDIAFSPERIDPLNKKWKITNTPKLVSGLTLNSKHRALDFYAKFVKTLVECDSLEIAETAKLLENSFRFINISFINELAMICQRLNIDIHQVISAASSKPYGFMTFHPSMGIGGHCIPVDPIYLADKATEIGTPSKFIALAEEINSSIPYNYVKLAEEKLGDLQHKAIIVLGVSYKPNVSDTRESPAQNLIFGLRQKGAKVFWNDELVSEWNGEKSVEIGDHYDLAVLTIHHDYMDLTKLGNVPILTTRGIS